MPEEEKMLLIESFQKKFKVIDDVFENLLNYLACRRSDEDPNEFVSKIWQLLFNYRTDILRIEKWYRDEFPKRLGRPYYNEKETVCSVEVSGCL
jgi:uncharacterized protein YecA (UPF0149 family)